MSSNWNEDVKGGRRKNIYLFITGNPFKYYKCDSKLLSHVMVQKNVTAFPLIFSCVPGAGISRLHDASDIYRFKEKSIFFH